MSEPGFEMVGGHQEELPLMWLEREPSDLYEDDITAGFYFDEDDEEVIEEDCRS